MCMVEKHAVTIYKMSLVTLYFAQLDSMLQSFDFDSGTHDRFILLYFTLFQFFCFVLLAVSFFSLFQLSNLNDKYSSNEFSTPLKNKYHVQFMLNKSLSLKLHSHIFILFSYSILHTHPQQRHRRR